MTDFQLSRLFLSLVCLLGLAHGLGYAFQRFRMPRVIGEITAGVVLGPSLFGYFFPQQQQSVFAGFPGQDALLSGLYWIGLVALMFTSGFRVQRKLDTEDIRTATAVMMAATVLPFLCGWFAADVFDFSPYAGPAQSQLAFRLVLGVAFAVTSIPVISKIFLDLGIIDGRFARIVLAVATIQDLFLWMALAVATGIVSGVTPDPAAVTRTIVTTLLFIALSLWLGPRLLSAVSDLRFNLIVKASATGYLFVVCFLFAAAASFFDVNAVFGALVAGMVVGSVTGARFDKVKERITDISMGLFVPVYFAMVGLKIDLPNAFDPVFTAGFIAVSSVIEIACVMIGARFAGRDGMTAFNFGVAMNTRGGPGIVLASVALAAGIVNEVFYVTLVLAAILTSLASGAWFRWLLARGRPLYGA